MADGCDELLKPLSKYRASAAVAGGSKSASSAPNGSTASGAAASAAEAPVEDERFQLLCSVGEECQTKPELLALLQRKPAFNLYDGFEPSGRMHIAQGIFKSINVNKCTKAGGTFLFWVADWFALMNDKMGGDLEKIKTVGKYLIEVWKASGMDMTRVKFLWSSDEITLHAKDYWMQALDIARRSTLSRIKKCCQIMGRKEGNLTSAQILYPIMQCTDIFFLKADICQLGVDQRKVNMLAREYCDWSSRKVKPIILSHHMLYGLKKAQAKMSKSDPDSAIFMEDSAADVERKIRNAYCPREPEAVEGDNEDQEEMHLTKDDLKNPCLDYVQYILFSKEGFKFEAGGKSYATFQSVKDAFVAGVISEDQLKDGIIAEVNLLLEPVRQHFSTDPVAKELLAKVSQWKKENLQKTASLTRLSLPGAGSSPAFAVFAPLPSEAVKLEDVLDVVRRLKLADAGSQPILFLEDWTAYTLGRLGGSVSCIQSFYTLLLEGVRALAPAGVMERTLVVWQGEMILSGPSEYWISVINAGRACNLEVVRSLTAMGEPLETAAQVVTALMHAGDVLALSTAGSPTLCADKYHENLHKLAAQYFGMLGLAEPTVTVAEQPSMRLMSPGEGVEADVNIMLTDAEVDVNRKIKRAFCQPANVEFCPPITVVQALLPHAGEVLVSRKPDNGGDVVYKEVDSLHADFAGEKLHPGDLKPAVGRLVNSVLEAFRPILSKVDTLKKAQKELEAFVKAQQKKR
mmetsp:Transcript_51903/g.123538  ORF Transcript_51903/g.123538 Transcript_51903/m.123538 type:complete len:744 (+) Transcript_51903:84-2315(+)